MKISTKLKLMSAGVMATLAIFSSLFFITNNKTNDIVSHVTKTTIPSMLKKFISLLKNKVQQVPQLLVVWRI